jgi:hypothetical protein
MILNSDRLCACLMAGAALFCLSLPSGGQIGVQVGVQSGTQASSQPGVPCDSQAGGSLPGTNSFASGGVTASDLPDAPLPQIASKAEDSDEAVAESPAMLLWSQSASSAQQAPGASGTDTTPNQPASAQKSQEQVAEEQLKQEKKQRMGVLPNFNASYIADAVPLTPGQKFRLMFSTEKDPATIGFSMFVALIGQAEGSHGGYGGGIGGYGKRFGQNYADTFDGAFWGNALLPSWWHQDPRYFRLGTGTAKHRIVYALLTNVRARHDGTRKWEPNYSNLVGNLISGGISNIYLPADERGLGSTFEGAATVTAEGGIGSMLEEFYPDFLHYLQRRKARKQAKQAGVLDAQPAPAH